MYRPLLLASLLFVQTSCIEKSNTRKTNSLSPKQIASPSVKLINIFPEHQKQSDSTFDSTVVLFSDTSYRLTLYVFNTRSYNEENSNATLTFSKRQNGQTQIFFHDSLYCMYPEIDFRDFNNDKIKDILVFYYTGARANPTYHLYLSDLKNRRLIYVKDFEDLPNPDLDTTNNIITSMALYGGNVGYSFYQINSKNKLINLGRKFEADLEDSIKYVRAIKQILEKRK